LHFLLQKTCKSLNRWSSHLWEFSQNKLNLTGTRIKINLKKLKGDTSHLTYGRVGSTIYRCPKIVMIDAVSPIFVGAGEPALGGEP